MFKKFQNVVSRASKIIDMEIGITDEAGLVLASSIENRINQVNPFIQDILSLSEECCTFGGHTFQKLFTKGRLEYIAYINNEGIEAEKYLSLISLDILNIKAFYDDKYDKSGFIKAMLADSISTGDIVVKSKEFHISYNANRIAYMIKVEKSHDMHAVDIMQGLFPNKSKDFIVILDDENIALIREVKNPDDTREIEKVAQSLIDTLNADLMVRAYIGIGSVADNLSGLSQSLKEAQMALIVGNIFENEKKIVRYDSLGLGRLVYQIPPEMCRVFLSEVFKEGSFDSLDSETLHTVRSFFEKDLNVSETSRHLYVHRNTLVYRLDKIQKLTGLDLRKFDDAVVFKVAMLIKKYVDSLKD